MGIFSGDGRITPLFNNGTMEILINLLNFFIHLDDHIAQIVANYGLWTYAIVFFIIFCETGLVFTPFLPGDSLLFVLGALAAGGGLKLELLLTLLGIAAIAGDSVNYFIGHLLAPKVLRQQKIRFIKQEHIERTRAFFEKYGGKTIIIARFVPIVRTFAPFLAGVGAMSYRKFLLYNVAGGILWVLVGVLSGYFFGNLPFVKKNFSLVILLIIVISLLPAVWEYLQHKKTVKR